MKGNQLGEKILSPLGPSRPLQKDETNGDFGGKVGRPERKDVSKIKRSNRI